MLKERKMLYCLGDIFNDMINTLFRSVDPTIKGFLVLAFLAVSFFFLSRTLKKGNDKRPIHVGYLLTFIIFFTLAILYATL